MLQQQPEQRPVLQSGRFSVPASELLSAVCWVYLPERQPVLWLVIPWDACWMKMFYASGIVTVAAFPGGLPDENKVS
jgi:hypothetical protein